MEVTGQEHEKQTYRLSFEEREEQEVLKVQVEFKSEWVMSKIFADSGDIRDAMAFFKFGIDHEFPLDWKKEFKVFSLHIPHAAGRFIFEHCMRYFSKVTSAPVQVTFREQPGYPQTLIAYNPTIISVEEVKELIGTIMQAILFSNISTEHIEPEVEEEFEDDEVDPDEILDYEEDEELKALMKPVKKTEYLPLGGD